MVSKLLAGIGSFDVELRYVDDMLLLRIGGIRKHCPLLIRTPARLMK